MRNVIKRLSALLLSGFCATMLGGSLVSCEPDSKEVLDSDYTIALTPENLQVAVKETLTITPEFSDPKATQLKYKWLSMNLNVATVSPNEDGTATVTGVETGSAEIKIVCTTIPLMSAVCTVEVFPRTVALDKGFNEDHQPIVEKIFKGKTLVVTPTFGGAGTAGMDFTWSSSDTDVATVVEGGNKSVTVTGVAPGTAKITITSDDDPELTASCDIEVVPYTITLTPNVGTIRKNGTVTVTPEFNDAAAEEFAYTWESDKPAIATVIENPDGTATIKGISDGIAKITVTCDTDPTLTVSRNVTIETWSVSLGASVETIEIGQTSIITPVFTPAAASSLTYEWTVSNEVSYVENTGGTITVTGLSDGEATITITAEEDPTITDEITVTVNPAAGAVFGFDNVWIDGSAVASGKTEIVATLENPDVYAWYGELAAGELTIPSELAAAASFIAPEDGAATFAATTAGAVEGAKLSATAVAWTIPAAGKYRVVLDKAAKTMAVYSPEIDLAPKTIIGPLSTDTAEYQVIKIWRYGGDGWSWKDEGWSQSAADPQVFIYNGTGFGNTVKFGVTNANASYVFTCGKGGGPTNVTVTHGVSYPIVEGSGGANPDNPRNTYFSMPGSTKFIILDIRNMTMIAYNANR